MLLGATSLYPSNEYTESEKNEKEKGNEKQNEATQSLRKHKHADSTDTHTQLAWRCWNEMKTKIKNVLHV